jgi:hypothetical protein
MARTWSADFLIRRIDRCYLLAACAKRPDKRDRHLERARHYRGILADTQELALA